MPATTTPVRLTATLKSWLVENGYALRTWTEDHLWKSAAAEAISAGDLTPDLFKSLQTTPDSPDAEKVFGSKSSGNGNSVRVKKQSERYSTEKRVGRHTKTGQPVANPFAAGRPTEEPSELEAAMLGVLFKHTAHRAGIAQCPLNEHESQLLTELCHSYDWAGKMNGDYHDRIPGGPAIKALIDDGTSGGLELTPIVFDDSIVTFPLLTGEVLPLVDIKDLSRGRRVEGGSLGNPTIAWGEGDDTTVSLFNTASLAAAIDTTVFGAAVSVEVGRDFLSDAGANVGAILQQNIGMRLAEELDDVIVNGNGSTQPEGLANASGLASVTPDNTTTGPPTLADYSDLNFAIGKQYRMPALNPAFISNDTAYARSRAIRVDPQSSTTDQRPVLTGGDTTSFNRYMTLGWPHRIQNDLANGTTFFGAMRKYRLYRRVGMEMRWEMGGTTLVRKNEALLILRARYGGQVMDSSAFAKWTNGQS